MIEPDFSNADLIRQKCEEIKQWAERHLELRPGQAIQVRIEIHGNTKHRRCLPGTIGNEEWERVLALPLSHPQKEFILLLRKINNEPLVQEQVSTEIWVAINSLLKKAALPLRISTLPEDRGKSWQEKRIHLCFIE
ncbi:MAG: hypothetical protein Q8P35_00910 [Candidatus Yanofskybacteria bacterium]|nr:hypothetical protein [Candidatus Yanofskybacteria bacterium]